MALFKSSLPPIREMGERVRERGRRPIGRPVDRWDELEFTLSLCPAPRGHPIKGEGLYRANFQNLSGAYQLAVRSLEPQASTRRKVEPLRPEMARGTRMRVANPGTALADGKASYITLPRYPRSFAPTQDEGVIGAVLATRVRKRVLQLRDTLRTRSTL